MHDQPDMLVSPDGATVHSVAALAESEVRELLAAGWRRLPFEQFVQETAAQIGVEPDAP